RAERDAHPWAGKPPGWIDYAFLGTGNLSSSIARIINTRAEAEGSGISYAPEVQGGRTRPDGKVLEWLISAPTEEAGRGVVPFYCGDITPREWRVPLEPLANAEHANSASGVAFVRIYAEKTALAGVSRQLTSVIGASPTTETATEVAWTLEHQAKSGPSPKLVLSATRTNSAVDTKEDEEATPGRGIFEVGFWVDKEREEGSVTTPYGKISWVHR
ncbi:hypothetical protein HWV62_32071, partial [Athelia sp. TMB]